MGQDMPYSVLWQLITNDFRSLWNATSQVEGDDVGRGNFPFALQGMIALEMACRYCASESSGKALEEFSSQLHRIEPRYFLALPGTASKPAEFSLPSRGSETTETILTALFDMVRNGQAHQYQQIRVQLSDGKNFRFALTGAEHGFGLDRIAASARPPSHLSPECDAAGDVWVNVRTDILFLDIEKAANAADLINRPDLSFNHLKRPRGKSKRYGFGSEDLKKALGL